MVSQMIFYVSLAEVNKAGLGAIYPTACHYNHATKTNSMASTTASGLGELKRLGT